MENNKENLVNYRLDKIEVALESLQDLVKIVQKWDVLFSSNNWFKSYPVVEEKVLVLETDVKDIKQDVETMKKFMWRAGGAFCVISLIIQLIVPYWLEHKDNHTSNSTTTSSTSSSSKP